MKRFTERTQAEIDREIEEVEDKRDRLIDRVDEIPDDLGNILQNLLEAVDSIGASDVADVFALVEPIREEIRTIDPLDPAPQGTSAEIAGVSFVSKGQIKEAEALAQETPVEEVKNVLSSLRPLDGASGLSAARRALAVEAPHLSETLVEQRGLYDDAVASVREKAELIEEGEADALDLSGEIDDLEAVLDDLKTQRSDLNEVATELRTEFDREIDEAISVADELAKEGRSLREEIEEINDRIEELEREEPTE